MVGISATHLGPVESEPDVTRWGKGWGHEVDIRDFWLVVCLADPVPHPNTPAIERNKASCTPPYPTSLLLASSGFGQHSSWGLESFLLSSEVTAFCLQAKYMVRRVSW